MADVVVERYGAVAVVKLNRPEVGNAVTTPMLSELGAAQQELDADKDVRAIVITGEGRMFCTGTDLSNQASTWSDQRGWDDERPGDPPSGAARGGTRHLNTPVIAAVNGSAVGAGLTIALGCDIRIVAEDAKLGAVFVRRGVIADGDLNWWLPRYIGLSNALDLLLTGRLISGRQAVEMGLASQAVAREQVLDTALGLAQDIAVNCSPLAMAVTKSLVYRELAEVDPQRAHGTEWTAFKRMGREPDAAEGPKSFMEKRDPVWVSDKRAVAEVLDQQGETR